MKSIAVLALSGAIGLSGCSVIAAKTNMLSDAKIISESAGALGYEPSQVSLISKRTEGANTYANLKAGGKEFTCIINGGNLMTMGMSNPPNCSRKGEPMRSNPLPH